MGVSADDDAAVLVVALGTSLTAPAETLQFMQQHFGPPPFASAYRVAADGGRHRWRAMQLAARLTSYLEPQAVVPFVTAAVPLLEEAGSRDRVTTLSVFGKALGRAGRDDEARALLTRALGLAQTAPGRRSASLALAESLRRLGQPAAALELSSAAADARRAEYGDGANVGVIEADLEVLLDRLDLGSPDLAKAMEVRAARIAGSGLASVGTLRCFTAVGRVHLAVGQPLPALANGMAALLCGRNRTVEHRALAEAHLLTADASWALPGGDRIPARLHARSAVDILRVAFGDDHPELRRAGQHPALA